MLHFYGDEEAFELGEKAKEYIWLYEKRGQDNCYVKYMDLGQEKHRYIKFEKINDQWVFVDLVDQEG